jgi:hypothetical protein
VWKRYCIEVASKKDAGRTAHKKFVPSEKQCAEDRRIKEKLDHLTEDDLRKFDRALERAFKPQKTAQSTP